MREYNALAICQFLSELPHDDLHIFHFVHETAPFDDEEKRGTDKFYIYLVSEGNGTLTTNYGEYSLSAGDLFFLFPQKPYKLRADGKWKLYYLSFLGTRAKALLQKFNLTYANCVRYRYDFLCDEWKKEFNRSKTSLSGELIAHSLFYKTLSYLAPDSSVSSSKDVRTELANRMQEYVDEHFSESALTLTRMSEVFHFHPNYLSYTFKEFTGVGFKKYLLEKRLTKACVLLATTRLSVTVVAMRSGFPDSLYFAKVFRARLGVTPTEHRRRAQATNV